MEEKVAQLLDLFVSSGIGYGDLIEKSTIDQWMNEVELDYPQLGRKAEFDAVDLRRLEVFQTFQDRLLLEQKMMLKVQHGSGNYQVVEPKDQTFVAAKDGMKKVGRALSKTAKRMEHVNLNLLTGEQRAENQMALAKINSLRRLSTTRAYLPGVDSD